MKKIRAITFPKSGVHLLSEILVKYFSKNPNYSPKDVMDSNNQPLTVGEFVFCHKDHHCIEMPCSYKKTTYQIGHGDHAPNWEENDGINYLFQFRNPIYSCVAFGSWDGKCTTRVNWKLDDYYHEVMEHFQDWKDWINKWVIGHTGEKVLCVVYENLVNYTGNEVCKVLEYIDPDTDIDIELLIDVIKNGFIPEVNGRHGISYKHYIDEWFLYDKMKPVLMEMERSVFHILDELKIPRIEWK